MDNGSSINWNVEEQFFEENNSEKERWDFKKGCSVGKKILVTGFVLSSAPMVLPPLAVISAFGFIVSIPYGIFLASYACTEKIMSMLLPNPSPPLLEYESQSNELALFYDDDDDYLEFEKHVEMVRKDTEVRSTELLEESNLGNVELFMDFDGSTPRGIANDKGPEFHHSDELVRKEVNWVEEVLEVRTELLEEQNSESVELFLDVDGAARGIAVDTRWELEHSNEMVRKEADQLEEVNEDTKVKTELLEELNSESVELFLDVDSAARGIAVRKEADWVEDVNEDMEVRKEADWVERHSESVELFTVDGAARGIAMGTGRVFEQSDDIVEGDGYEEYIHEHVEKDQPAVTMKKRDYDQLSDNLLVDVDVDVVLVQGGEDELAEIESRETPIELTTVVVDENEGPIKRSDTRDEDELLKETLGLLEKIEDKRKADGIPEVNEKQHQDMMSIRSTGNTEYSNVLIEKHLTITNGEVEEISIVEVVNDSEVIHEVKIESMTKDAELIGEEVNLTTEAGNRTLKPLDSFEEGGEKRGHQKPVQSREDDNVTTKLNIFETSEGFSHGIDDEAVNFAKLSNSSMPNKSEGEAGVSSVIAINVTDDELENEEKVKEEIERVKKILGYKGKADESCREELNALYKFVGIEPPSDVNQVEQNLQFLMSIVGVK